MLFSGSNKREAREAAESIEGSFKTAFRGSQYSSANGGFRPPHDLYTDDYCFGFCYSFADCVYSYSLNGNPNNFPSFSGEFFRHLGRNQNFDLSAFSSTNVKRLWSNLENGITDGKFVQGTEDASLLYAAMFDIVSSDFNSQILDRARETVSASIRRLGSSDVKLPGGYGNHLASAILSITLFEYISKKWIAAESQVRTIS